MKHLKVKVPLWQYTLQEFWFFFELLVLITVVGELLQQGRSIWMIIRLPLLIATIVTVFTYFSARAKATDETAEIEREKHIRQIHKLIEQGLDTLRAMAVANGLNFDELIASGKSLRDAAELIYERDKLNNQMQIN